MRSEHQLLPDSKVPRSVWRARAVCAEEELERERAKAKAWADLARAERRNHGVARFGTDAEKNAAFWAVQTARDALRAMGIDPDKEE